jgi:hypothetical protein
MPSVQVPKSLESVLPFVAKFQDRKENPIFETYAQLMTFAAALGFNLTRGKYPPANAPKTNLIESIDWEYFSSEHQKAAIQIIGLVAGNGVSVVNDLETLVQLLRDLAAVGGQKMSEVLRSYGDSGFHLGLSELLIGAAEGNFLHENP